MNVSAHLNHNRIGNSRTGLLFYNICIFEGTYSGPGTAHSSPQDRFYRHMAG